MARRAGLAAYALWMGLLAAVYYLVPAWHTGVWAAIGASGVLAILAGVRINKPRLAAPWLLLYSAVTFYAAGNVAFALAIDGGSTTSAVAYGGHVSYLLFVVLLVLAILRFVRVADPGRDRAALIDGLVLMLGIGLLVWVLTVEVQFNGSGSSTLNAALVVAYPAADILVFATFARFVTAVRFSTAVLLLSMGAAGLLVAEMLFRLAWTHQEWPVGEPLDLGFFSLFAFWGAAALVPSMRELTAGRLQRPRELTWLRLALLALSAMVPPSLLLYESLAYPMIRHAGVIAVASAVMFLLVLLRLGSLARRLRDQIARERGLREVTTALVGAADNDGIAEALDEGVRRVLAPGTPYHFLLLTEHGDIESPGHHVGMLPGERARAAVDRLRKPTLLETNVLPLYLARALGVREPAGGHASRRDSLTLAIPLTVAEREATNAATIGIMLIAAPESALVPAHNRLILLASQAALAVDRVKLNEELTRRNSEAYFRALVHHAADVILIVDDEGRIGYASPSARAMFGDVDLVGTALLAHADEAERAEGERALRRLVDGPPGHTDLRGTVRGDWTIRRSDGVGVQVEVSVRDLRDEPTVRGLVFTLRDVTEQRRLERELTHRAYHDALTGLANRMLFAERVQKAIDTAERRDVVVGVLFVDIDDFKVVNDTLGHETGDEVLIAVGRRITATLRPQDTAARLGGDEFAILIGDAPSPVAVEEVADRLTTALREPYTVAGQLVTNSASVGVGTTADARDGPELLRQADLALYVAKGAGKSQWRRYQPDLHTTIVERLELRAELDQAIHNGGLTLEYQPIVSLADGRTTGFEALLRWDHPSRGWLLPDAFIEVAEESGLVVPIGEWVLRTAIGAAATWRRREPLGAPYVSVNVSARQFRAPGFVPMVKRELTAAGLPASCLMLEITESLLLRDDEQVWDDLAEVRRLGVRVAIDDFGTGYSSLSYLRHVPLDVLKIDRLFTGTIAASAQQRALVDGIVRLAHTLGLEVVAEGIETAVERDLLTRIGCPYGQGFLFSRPMRLADARRWLERAHVAA